jgi:hypothetical protein
MIHRDRPKCLLPALTEMAASLRVPRKLCSILFIYVLFLTLLPQDSFLVYKVVVVKLLGEYLFDITAWSELEAQAFRYTRINIC